MTWSKWPCHYLSTVAQNCAKQKPVNHRFLLHKLVAYGMDAGLIRWIQAFLQDRSFRVAVNGCVSEFRSAQSGVPQGTVLGPIPFLIYINDLSDPLQEKVSLFADDARLISQRSHSQTLQNDQMKAYEWSKDWNLPLNESKCAFLTSRSSPPTPYSHFDGGPELQQLHSVKDLGILLDFSLKPSVHCIAAAKKTRAVLFLVKRSFVN